MSFTKIPRIRFLLVMYLIGILPGWAGLTASGQDTAKTRHPSSQYEWEMSKNSRYEAALMPVIDSLRFVLQRRWIVGVGVGAFLMPAYVSTARDVNTGVDMRSNAEVIGGFVEYCKRENTRLGMEISFQSTKKVISVTQSGTGIGIDGSGGLNIPISFYLKRFISAKRSYGMVRTLHDNSGDSISERSVMDSVSNLNRWRMRQVRCYWLASAGGVFTILFHVRGANDNIAGNSYEQQAGSVSAGFGIFSRVGERTTADLSFRYIQSTNYSPPIGSVSSYSGFKITLQLGFIVNSWFNRVKDQFSESYK